jgi:hypothetical protein
VHEHVFLTALGNENFAPTELRGTAGKSASQREEEGKKG